MDGSSSIERTVHAIMFKENGPFIERIVRI